MEQRIPGRKKDPCKGPEAGLSRKSRKIRVAGCDELVETSGAWEKELGSESKL